MQAGGHRFDPGQLHQALRSAEQTWVASGGPRVKVSGAAMARRLVLQRTAQLNHLDRLKSQTPIPDRETGPAGSLYIVNMVLTETRQQLPSHGFWEG